MKKTFVAIVMAVVMLMSVACSKDGDNGAVVPSRIEFFKDGQSEFEVIIESDSPASAEAAKQFVALFKEKTGIALDISYDNGEDDGDYTDATKKILFGRTGYQSSKSLFEGLKYNDYKLEITKETLTVAAYSADAYAVALAYIDSNVLSSLQDKGGAYEFEGESFLCGESNIGQKYVVDEWTVLGVPISEYKIVYASVSLEKVATALQKEIAERTGYVIECVRDKFTEPSPYEILIGDTTRPESDTVQTPEPLHYVLKLEGTKLVFKAGGYHSNISGAEEMVSKITDGITTLSMEQSFLFESNFIDDPYDHSFSDGADIRIMSANVQANLYGYNKAMEAAGFDFDRCAEIFYSSLDVYEPTVVGLQECCPDWRAAIKNYSGYDKWCLMEFDNPIVQGEKVFSTIMYRKDLLTLLDSGMQYYSKYGNNQCRAFAWAVFKDNASGKEFAFASTHWDMNSASNSEAVENSLQQCLEMGELMNMLSAKYPVFTTGDFNCSEYSDIFKSLMSVTNSVDCMHAAENRLNQDSSHHGWGKPTTGTYSPDHITAPSEARILKFESLIYNEQEFASDHSWLIADVVIPTRT